MKIFQTAQIREIDSYTISNEPITSVNLMERAAQSVTNWVIKNCDILNEILVFAGSGNNGGDALAVARQLNDSGYYVTVFMLLNSNSLSSDCQINLDRIQSLKNSKLTDIKSVKDIPIINKENIIIDGLFGSGLSRPLDGLALNVVKHINASGAKIISIDIPSGLFCEDNSNNNQESIVKANITLTLQFPKLSFFFPENQDFIGEWFVLPIGLHQEIINSTETPFYFLTNQFIKSNLKQRKKFSHKGTYGHALLIAGSYGKMGAAILASKSCLRSGCGLVTVHIPKCGYSIMQTALPETMVSIDHSDYIFTDVSDVTNYTSVGVGPGIGTESDTVKGLTTLLNDFRNPMVIDADALNILSENKELIKNIPVNSILTPHPKEFERLVGKWTNDYERLQKQIQFSVNNSVFVVLKGAHTSVTCPDGTCYFNTTGNPGMATAGSGDVLTGIILSLLGQGYESKFAALIGVFLQGTAGDIASEKIGEETLIASDIIENLGYAFLKIKT